MRCSCGVQSIEECNAMHDIVLVREIENNEYAVHRLRSFTYGLQHPDIYLVSAKTFATNLVGVCIGVEHNNDQKLLNRTLKMLGDGKIPIEKPPVLHYFGDLNISHVMDAKNALEYKRLVEEWAKDVWKAYGIYHGLAHEWIHIAMD
jgi:hypothetical protein